MAPKAAKAVVAKKAIEIIADSPPITDAVDDIPAAPHTSEKTPPAINVTDIEAKAPDAPKKRGRKAKTLEDGENVAKVRKPRAKKVLADKNTDDEVKPVKKERKPRAKTEYNIFIGEKMKELREKHKDDGEKLKTTEYMKMAIVEWKLHKEAKANN